MRTYKILILFLAILVYVLGSPVRSRRSRSSSSPRLIRRRIYLPPAGTPSNKPVVIRRVIKPRPVIRIAPTRTIYRTAAPTTTII